MDFYGSNSVKNKKNRNATDVLLKKIELLEAGQGKSPVDPIFHVLIDQEDSNDTTSEVDIPIQCYLNTRFLPDAIRERRYKKYEPLTLRSYTGDDASEKVFEDCSATREPPEFSNESGINLDGEAQNNSKRVASDDGPRERFTESSGTSLFARMNEMAFSDVCKDHDEIDPAGFFRTNTVMFEEDVFTLNRKSPPESIDIRISNTVQTFCETNVNPVDYVKFTQAQTLTRIAFNVFKMLRLAYDEKETHAQVLYRTLFHVFEVHQHREAHSLMPLIVEFLERVVYLRQNPERLPISDDDVELPVVPKPAPKKPKFVRRIKFNRFTDEVERLQFEKQKRERLDFIGGLLPNHVLIQHAEKKQTKAKWRAGEKERIYDRYLNTAKRYKIVNVDLEWLAENGFISDSGKSRNNAVIPATTDSILPSTSVESSTLSTAFDGDIKPSSLILDTTDVIHTIRHGSSSGSATSSNSYSMSRRRELRKQLNSYIADLPPEHGGTVVSNNAESIDGDEQRKKRRRKAVGAGSSALPPKPPLHSRKRAKRNSYCQITFEEDDDTREDFQEDDEYLGESYESQPPAEIVAKKKQKRVCFLDQEICASGETEEDSESSEEGLSVVEAEEETGLFLDNDEIFLGEYSDRESHFLLVSKDNLPDLVSCLKSESRRRNIRRIKFKSSIAVASFEVEKLPDHAQVYRVSTTAPGTDCFMTDCFTVSTMQKETNNMVNLLFLPSQDGKIALHKRYDPSKLYKPRQLHKIYQEMKASYNEFFETVTISRHERNRRITRWFITDSLLFNLRKGFLRNTYVSTFSHPHKPNFLLSEVLKNKAELFPPQITTILIAVGYDSEILSTEGVNEAIGFIRELRRFLYKQVKDRVEGKHCFNTDLQEYMSNTCIFYRQMPVIVVINVPEYGSYEHLFRECVNKKLKDTVDEMNTTPKYGVVEYLDWAGLIKEKATENPECSVTLEGRVRVLMEELAFRYGVY